MQKNKSRASQLNHFAFILARLSQMICSILMASLLYAITGFATQDDPNPHQQYPLGTQSTDAASNDQIRLFVVNSFHQGNLWEDDTLQGLISGLKQHGYITGASKHEGEFLENLQKTGFAQTPQTLIKMAWMDAQRNSSPSQLALNTRAILAQLHGFSPDLVFLGDNVAINYIGNALIDSNIPVVFWGLNGLPLKYGLVETIDNPERNITGVWQIGFHVEAVKLLKRLVPEAETFGIIADDSVTARTNVKQLRAMAAENQLALTLKGVVQTQSFQDYKTQTLALAETVDAFYILHNASLKDTLNTPVDSLTVTRWYLENIHLPEVSNEGQFVRQGMLAAVDESGYEQARMAVDIAHDILDQDANPGRIRVKSATSAQVHINQHRAAKLNIELTRDMTFIDKIVTEKLALDPPSAISTIHQGGK